MTGVQMFIILFCPLFYNFENGPSKNLKTKNKHNYPKLYLVLIVISFLSFLMMIYLFSF